MALVKYGGGILAMSGSIGGNTFARNRYGSYIRARTKPVNPNTPGQQSVRAAIAWLVEHWSQTLDADQRAAWGHYADNLNMLNKLGEVMRLSGFNHFVRSNAIRKRNGDTVVLDGPSIFEIPEHDPTFAFTLSAATQELSVTFDNTAGWASEAGGHLYVFVGTPQNPQRNFFAGPWKFGDVIDGDEITPPTSPATIVSPWVVYEGQRVWIYGRISRLDGRLSNPFRSGPTLVANGA